jgi:hypothetical protein
MEKRFVLAAVGYVAVLTALIMAATHIGLPDDDRGVASDGGGLSAASRRHPSFLD